VNALLRNTKKLLIEWGFVKSSVQYDTEWRKLSVGGTVIFEASVEKFALNITWLDQNWAEWKEFQNDPKFTELISVSQAKLDQSKKRLDKGKGKGPASSS
jgi:hypothetical protein